MHAFPRRRMNAVRRVFVDGRKDAGGIAVLIGWVHGGDV